MLHISPCIFLTSSLNFRLVRSSMLRRACSFRWNTRTPLCTTSRALYSRQGDTKDFYTLLGVSKTATPEEIKKAYRRKAIEKHPDQGGSSEEFTKINEAYSVLSDSSKRSMYDQYGSEGVSEQAGGGSPGFNPEDIFSQFFGGKQHARAPSAPMTEDKAISISVTLAEL
ncbi:DnaJ domain-containinging protein, partial [Perkinsela sp. CCAP 1560/4]